MIIDDLFPREPQRTFLQKLVASCNEQIINHRIFVHLGRQAAIDRGISGNNEFYFVIALSDQIETVEPVRQPLHEPSSERDPKANGFPGIKFPAVQLLSVPLW